MTGQSVASSSNPAMMFKKTARLSTLEGRCSVCSAYRVIESGSPFFPAWFTSANFSKIIDVSAFSLKFRRESIMVLPTKWILSSETPSLRRF